MRERTSSSFVADNMTWQMACGYGQRPVVLMQVRGVALELLQVSEMLVLQLGLLATARTSP